MLTRAVSTVLLDLFPTILQHVHQLPVLIFRLMVECSSSLSSPGEVKLHVMDQPLHPPAQSTPATVTVQLRIAAGDYLFRVLFEAYLLTSGAQIHAIYLLLNRLLKYSFPLDESFTSFHPEAHLPLGLIRGRPVYVEVSLLDPPEPSLVLLVHSCLAYTQAAYSSWMLVYDGCVKKNGVSMIKKELFLLGSVLAALAMSIKHRMRAKLYDYLTTACYNLFSGLSDQCAILC